MVDMAFHIAWIAFTIFLAIAVHFCLSVKQQRSKRHVKITVKFMAVKDDEVEGKENFYKLLVAVIQNHPQVLQNAHQNQRVEIEIAGDTIYIALSEESAEVIDFNHVVDHVRYCIQTITEDTANCIKLMKHPPGPNFQTSITTLRLALPNNAKLDIISDPPIQTNTNLVIWPSGYTPQEWMEQYKTSISVIHTVKDYKDILERKGLDGILKTKKENIRRMLKLNMINPGDGLYLVRTKCGMTYAHVAVVTDAKFMNFVHVSKKPSLPFFGEYGTIVEDHFEKVVKEEDKCFIVRHRHKELTGQNIADRAMTFARLPALTFTYNVINANCEVAFNAAAGIFQEGRGSLQGQLVQEPYYDRVKRTFGLALEKLQKSPESELLEKLYFKLLTNGMLREAAQGHPDSAQTEQRTDDGVKQPLLCPGTSHSGKNYLGIAICFDAYEGSLKLETAAFTEEMRDIVKTLKNKFRYKFPYEDSMGLDTFVNPKDLMRSLDIFLTKKYMKVHQSTDVCLLYFHGHGKFVKGQPCIRTLSGKDNIIPVFEIMYEVHAKTLAGRFYIIFDCCSDFPEDEVDKDTRERVEKVQKTQKDVTFSDRVVVIKAAPDGHTAPATAGETLSSVLCRVLQSNNGKGFLLDDLQQQLSEEYHRRNLEPIFTINRQNNTVFPY